MGRISWKLDGVALPRNPDSYDVKWDKANVSYEPQASGVQIRVAAPQLIGGADFTITFMDADGRTKNIIMQAFNPMNFGLIHKLTIDGIQPAQQAFVYFDTPEKMMSKDIYTTKFGEGGTRNDLSLTLRMDRPYWRSLNNVSSSTAPLVTDVAASFGGAAGNGIDGIPVWGGQAWNINAGGVASGSVAKSISNLGTAPWSPVIRIHGPFTTAVLTQTYFDADGTGAGTAWSWTGAAVASGDYVLFDTYYKRTYLSVSGALGEVYTWKVYTIADSLPFSYWPPVPPGSANPVSLVTTGYGTNTALDYSNAGTELFAYW